MVHKSRPSLKSHLSSDPGPLTKAAMVIGIICIISIIGGLATYSSFFNERVVVDNKTGCPKDGPYSRTVILIDQTDTFSPVQANDIQNQFEKYKKSIPRYGELVIYAMRQGTKNTLKPLIRACNPGTKDDINQLVESSNKISQQWTVSFDEPVRKVLKDALQPMSSKNSPIIETMQAFVVSEFGPVYMDNKDKKLVIISDLLQHSKVLSHYKPNYDVDKFIQSQKFSKLTADLRDVEVDFLYLLRNTQKAHQNFKHREFWRGLIGVQGGTVGRYYQVSG